MKVRDRQERDIGIGRYSLPIALLVDRVEAIENAKYAKVRGQLDMGLGLIATALQLENWSTVGVGLPESGGLHPLRGRIVHSKLDLATLRTRRQGTWATLCW